MELEFWAGLAKADQSFRAARSTPAFGRAVRVFDPSFVQGLKSRPILASFFLGLRPRLRYLGLSALWVRGE
jgi:hypothetical protein